MPEAPQSQQLSDSRGRMTGFSMSEIVHVETANRGKSELSKTFHLTQMQWHHSQRDDKATKMPGLTLSAFLKMILMMNSRVWMEIVRHPRTKMRTKISNMRALPVLLTHSRIGEICLGVPMTLSIEQYLKRDKDLLNKDFHTDQKFTLTTYTSSGAAITAASTKKNEAIFSEVQAKLKQKNVTVDVKATSDSLLLTTVTIEEFGVPGLKKIVTIPFPNQTAGKAEVQYLHDYAGINASFGLNSKPLVNFSGVLGNKDIAVGADVAYDTATGDFTKYNAGLSFTNADLIAAVTLNNKGDSLTASYYHLVNVEKNTAVGAEVTRSFSSKQNTVTFGTQHALDPSTTVKARYNSNGVASALIQHEWRPKSFFTLSTEVDTKAFEKSSKVGLSLVLKP